MASFWDKKMSGQAAPPPPHTPRYGQDMMPRGVGLDHERALLHYLNQQQMPVQDPQQEFEGEEIPPGHIPASVAIRSWKGDIRGAAKQTGKCPSCDSPRYITPTNAGKQNQHGDTVYPAPVCADCGFSESTRTVMQGTLGVGAQSMGPVSQARQGEGLAPQWTPQLKV